MHADENDVSKSAVLRALIRDAKEGFKETSSAHGPFLGFKLPVGAEVDVAGTVKRHKEEEENEG
ncbi:hypothetical protein AKJ64_00990 [candidate division MSBL1 archaeon SCGC-AAA259E17]|uniref:Uncharacterized protein n=1 Tax=candidate division MSBL1 archaeon SCGC-AAA259E17 TaxID=1698263 RepID=A0A133UGG6_9EURY|nr:hypothetical protein AKJ64_00990 [candidate division MSBL1 archaeon SCGC-AAA259E17]